MKNVFYLLAFLMIGATGAQTSWTCPAGFEGQQLNVYNWTTYIADNTIADFEKLCGSP